MLIRKAREDDIKAMRKLWKSAFSDTDEYLNFFFQKRFSERNARILEIGNKTVGMMHLLPCKIQNGSEAVYWYAVAIDENERGKGYGRFFCKEVLEELSKAGISSVCLPANGLDGFYKSIGFENEAFIKETAFHCDLSNDCKVFIERAVPSDFLKIPVKEGSVLWDLPAISYAFEENVFCGGDAIKVSVENQIFFALCVKKEDHFVLTSTNFNHIVFEKIKDSVCSYLKTNTVILQEYCLDKKEGILAGLSNDPKFGIGAQLPFSLF